MSKGRVKLNELHDLVLLYLGLARADNELDPDETQEIALKLRQWQPDKDPALLDHVIREAELTFDNGIDDEHLQEVISELGASFSESLRRSILRDLADIARADNTVETVETDYIRRIAEGWRIDLDSLHDSTSSSLHQASPDS